MALTPDGTKNSPKSPQNIDECWIQADQFPNLVKYAADPIKSLYLDNMIITSCGAVNSICNRYFNKQTIDEIFPNEGLFTNEYNEFVLKNRPLIEVKKVWLQIVSTFAEVENTYLQVLTEESIVKILPTLSLTSSVPFPFYRDKDASNVWIRYDSGFAVDYSGQNTTNEVPFEVRLATASYVDYLFSMFDMQGGISEFKTQTYSQKNAKASEDPLLSSVKGLLKDYIITNVK